MHCTPPSNPQELGSLCDGARPSTRNLQQRPLLACQRPAPFPLVICSLPNLKNYGSSVQQSRVRQSSLAYLSSSLSRDCNGPFRTFLIVAATFLRKTRRNLTLERPDRIEAPFSSHHPTPTKLGAYTQDGVNVDVRLSKYVSLRRQAVTGNTAPEPCSAASTPPSRTVADLCSYRNWSDLLLRRYVCAVTSSSLAHRVAHTASRIHGG